MLALSLAAALTAQPADAARLWYTAPARDWMTQALPLGNGRLGSMVFGGVQREQLQFNEDSLWIGDEHDTGAYQAFGDVFLELSPDGRPRLVAAECTSGHASPGGESVEASIDGSPDTKWCLEHHGQPAVWVGHYPSPEVISTYAFTSANDMPDRDPQAWTLEGSTDGQAWTVVDQRTDEPVFANRHERRVYTCTNTRAFAHYRFTFAKVRSATHFQVAEIELGHAGQMAATATDAPADYRRELDLDRAIHTVSYTRGGVHFRRELFVSHPAGVLVLHLTADQPGAYSGAVALADAHRARTVAAGDRLTASGTLAGYKYDDAHADYAIALAYESQLRLRAEGGTVRAEGGRLLFAGATSLTLLLDAGTDYVADRARGWRGAPPHAAVTQRLDRAAAQTFEALRAAHLADYQELAHRVTLDLGASTPAARALPTHERLLRYTQGSPDPELETLVFAYGRYLLAASSRDALPANLQGLWNNSNRPPWRCDYHSDVNVQMNYWPCDVVNLSDCFQPLADWVAAGAAVRTEQTKAQFGTRGWTSRAENGIFGGSSWEYIPAGSAWLCQNLFDHYAFTGDLDYLRRLYPLLREVCAFWADHLKALPDGTLVAPHDFSPEHGPVEDGVSFAQQLVWDLFTNTLEAAQALGTDTAYQQKLTDLRAHLLAPRIGKWGQLQEWMVDRDDPKDDHRHVSHMIALYPGRQIAPHTTPALAEAAKVSLNARGDLSTGWAMAWRICLWARLLDGDHAYRLLRNFIHLTGAAGTNYTSGGGLYPNLLCAHPPFQIDGNFGSCAGMAELLLQSHLGTLDLLPALPSAWPTGAVTGLRARGGFVVDLAWTDHRLTSATIASRAGGTARVRLGDRQVDVRVPAGGQVRLNGQLAAMAP